MNTNREEILECLGSPSFERRVGNSKANTIDKNGRFYHVTQKTWCGMPLYNADIARYRHHLLCELCIKHGVTILYSVVMPTHTHDVLHSSSWKNISKVMQILNSRIVKYVSRRYPQRKGFPMFCERPQYIVVKDMLHLHFLGKYVEDNVASLEKQGKQVPYSCFWMFESGHFVPPYNADIYEKLFAVEPKELYEYYKTHTKKEVWSDSFAMYGGLPSSFNDSVFKADPSTEWLSS